MYLAYITETDLLPGPGHYSTDKVRYGAISDQPTPRASAIVGKERYQWKNWAPAPTKYAVPYTFGAGSIDKSGGKSWSIQVSWIKTCSKQWKQSGRNK